MQQVAEGKQEEIQQKGQAEKKELQTKIDEMEEKEQELQAKIEALQADNDFTNERLTALQGKLVRQKLVLFDFCSLCL
jgi:peptidoglycan hydrolase CwlO-like protein